MSLWIDIWWLQLVWLFHKFQRKKTTGSFPHCLTSPSTLRSFEPVDVIEILQVNQVNLSTAKCIFKQKEGVGGGGNGEGTVVGGIDRFYKRFTESQKMHHFWRKMFPSKRHLFYPPSQPNLWIVCDKFLLDKFMWRLLCEFSHIWYSWTASIWLSATNY